MFSKKFKKQMAYVLASTFVFGLVNPSAIKVRASTGVEITEGVTVTAKGNTEGNTADLAIDGDLSTYWESSNDYKWIEVDLGGVYELSERLKYLIRMKLFINIIYILQKMEKTLIK